MRERCHHHRYHWPNSQNKLIVKCQIVVFLHKGKHYMQDVANFSWVLSTSPEIVSQTFQLADAAGNVVMHQVLGPTINTLSVPVSFATDYVATLTCANALLSSAPVTLSFKTSAAPVAPEAPTSLTEKETVTP